MAGSVTTKSLESETLETIRDVIDREFYLSQLKNVDVEAIDPAEHYVAEGADAGLDPTRGFSTERYLGIHPDLPARGINPFHHFLTMERTGEAAINGYPERRAQRNLAARHFDADYYLSGNRDVDEASAEPLDHFLTRGWREGRNPAAWFDLEHYTACYSDRIAVGQNPFMHYLEEGIEAGLLPCQAADDDEYRTVASPSHTSGPPVDDATWGRFVSTALSNYGLSRQDDLEGALTHDAVAFFDRHQLGDGRLSGWIATRAALSAGERVELIIGEFTAAGGVADDGRPDVAEFFDYPHISGIAFEACGRGRVRHDVAPASDRRQLAVMVQGRSCPAFTVNGVDPDVATRPFAAVQLSQRLHQRRLGANMPLPAEVLELIQSSIGLRFYSASAGIPFANPREAAAHYLHVGAASGLDPAPWFRTAYYAARPEVQRSSMNPLYHYLTRGKAAGISPSDEGPLDRGQVEADPEQALRRLFDNDFYLGMNPDLHDVVIDPFEHFMTQGWKEGRDPCRRFSVDFYLEQNPDIAAARINPFEHYALRGWRDNRRPHPEHCRIDLDLADDPRRARATLHLPTRTRPALNAQIATSPLSLAVHVHAFHVELLGPLLDRLDRLPQGTSLFVTTDTEEKVSRIESDYGAQLKSYRTSKIVQVENVGRDVFPMLALMRIGFGDADLVLHVHTKKSDHLGEYAERWNDHILRHLIGDEATVAAMLDHFASDPTCGLAYPIAPRAHTKYMTWGDNRPLARQLLERLGLDPTLVERTELDFPVGNMMWFRPEALARLNDAGLGEQDFPAEPIDVDGTIAHALERCLPLIVEASGHRVVKTCAIPPAHMPVMDAATPAISLIVPMLDCSDWLHDSVGSVLRQQSMLPSIELLLVDNGSTDGTLQLAQHYARSFANIECVSESVKGAGNARNTGLSLARGQYVMFLDADDLLADGALQSLYTAACEADADLVTSQLRLFDEHSVGRPMPNFGPAISDRPIDVARFARDWNNYAPTTLERETLCAVFGDFGPCAKLYRRASLSDAGVRFDEGTNYEDNVFVYRAYLNANRLVVLDETSYFYRKSTNVSSSQSCRVDEHSLADLLAAYGALESLVGTVRNEHLRELMSAALENRALDLMNDPLLGPHMMERFTALLRDGHDDLVPAADLEPHT